MPRPPPFIGAVRLDSFACEALNNSGSVDVPPWASLERSDFFARHGENAELFYPYSILGIAATESYFFRAKHCCGSAQLRPNTLGCVGPTSMTLGFAAPARSIACFKALKTAPSQRPRAVRDGTNSPVEVRSR